MRPGYETPTVIETEKVPSHGVEDIVTSTVGGVSNPIPTHRVTVGFPTRSVLSTSSRGDAICIVWREV